MNYLLKHLFLLLIRLYQGLLSPFLPNSCRFQPTCSEYAKQAFIKYGFFKGFRLAIRRISRCHPWGDSGFDPVP
jgi:putative membrane protein insertion efficiency factor